MIRHFVDEEAARKLCADTGGRMVREDRTIERPGRATLKVYRWCVVAPDPPAAPASDEKKKGG